MDGAAARSLSQRVMTDLQEDTVHIEQTFLLASDDCGGSSSSAVRAYYTKQVGVGGIAGVHFRRRKKHTFPFSPASRNRHPAAEFATA